MRFLLLTLFTLATVVPSATSQVTTSRERILFYTADWHGERFPDGRPKIADSLQDDPRLHQALERLWSKG